MGRDGDGMHGMMDSEGWDVMGWDGRRGRGKGERKREKGEEKGEGEGEDGCK